MDSNPRSPVRRTTLFETPRSQHARAPPRPSNARRPVQQLLLPVVDPVGMNAELTRQLGDRPVPPTAATTCPRSLAAMRTKPLKTRSHGFTPCKAGCWIKMCTQYPKVPGLAQRLGWRERSTPTTSAISVIPSKYLSRFAKKCQISDRAAGLGGIGPDRPRSRRVGPSPSTLISQRGEWHGWTVSGDEPLIRASRLAGPMRGADPAKFSTRAQGKGGTLCLITTTSLSVVVLPAV
jgi:hypothetical protein